jgi:hypothetical protein
MRSVVALILILLAPASPGAPQFPDHFAAHFVLKAFGATVGEGEWRLKPSQNGRFVWEAHARTAGIALLFRDVKISETSQSEYFEQSFRPLMYRYDRTGDNKAETAEVSFDWHKGIARNTVKGKTWQMPVPVGTLDKITYLLAMMSDLSAGKRTMRYTIADGGKLKVYDMRELGTETLDTPLGSLETLKMERHRRDGRETTLWCAPALGFLPVKVMHREREGWSVTMYVERLEGRPPNSHGAVGEAVGSESPPERPMRADR